MRIGQRREEKISKEGRRLRKRREDERRAEERRGEVWSVLTRREA